MLQELGKENLSYQINRNIMDGCPEMEFLAYEYLNEQNLNEAEKIFPLIQRNNPYYFGAYEGMAYVQFERGNMQTSKQMLKKALTLAKSQFLNPKINLDLVNLLESNLEKIKQKLPIDIPWTLL